MSVTGLILSGGLGRRMGAVDKGLQSFHGRPMVEQVIERFAPQVDKLAINANQHLDTYQDFGLPIWPDEMQGFPGPLAGLQAGLTHCDTPYLVTVPCDSPFLPMNLVERLMTTMQTEHADIAYAITGTAEARQAHPVFCLIKVSLLPLLTAYLEKLALNPDAEIHGATGTLRMDGFGNIQRRPTWSTFSGGRPVPLTGAGDR